MFFNSHAVIVDIAALRAEYNKSRNIFVPARSFNSLTYRCEGEIGIEHNGKWLVSEKGFLTFIPQGVPYNTEIYKDGFMFVIQFKTISEVAFTEPAVWRCDYPLAFYNLFESLCNRYFRVWDNRDFECLSIFYEILAKLQAEEERKEKVIIPKRIRQARDRIETDFNESSLTVSSLSHDAKVSEVYFRRKFKECFGSQPSKYIRKTRIENAKMLLQTGMYTVGEVAIRSGYESISYFSYDFKRITGITPNEYKNKFE